MIIDGVKLAGEIKNQVAEAIKNTDKKVTFSAIIVGDNAASKLYVEKKKQACDLVGIDMSIIELPADVSQERLNGVIRSCDSHGLLLQLPLPKGLDAREAIACIPPEKDVDGLTAVNFGTLAQEGDVLSPCTALGVLCILKSAGVKIAGANAVVVGRSNIVGKPVAMLLMRENATVTICHKWTRDLGRHIKRADIVVAAAGVPNLVKAHMIKRGAAVVDVGINRLSDGKIVGDVDFARVSKKAGVITPVPGGVGPLTIAFLLHNIVRAFEMQEQKSGAQKGKNS